MILCALTNRAATHMLYVTRITHTHIGQPVRAKLVKKATLRLLIGLSGDRDRRFTV
jgi:hypothetical protein